MGKQHPKTRPDADTNLAATLAKRHRSSSKRSQNSSHSHSHSSHNSRSSSPLTNMSHTDDDDNVRAELAATKRQVVELTVATKKSKKPKKDPLWNVINQAFRKEVWREAKFISGEGQLTKVSKLVLKFLAYKDIHLDSTDPHEVDKVDQWTTAHNKTVSSILNGHRSYVVQRIKDTCWAFMDVNGHDSLPTAGAIEHIIARDKHVDEDIMMWWWDKILPMAAGNTDHWSVATRYYGTITDSFVGGDPAKGREIPCGTEAFAAVAFISNRAKWIKMHELQEAGKSFNIVKNSSKVKDKGPKILNLFYDEHRELVPTWTDTNVGQALFGGWSQEGLKKFVELRKLCKTSRGTKRSEALEKKILKALREENGIAADNYVEHRKSLGYGKKVATSVAAVAEVAGLFDDEDSD